MTLILEIFIDALGVEGAGAAATWWAEGSRQYSAWIRRIPIAGIAALARINLPSQTADISVAAAVGELCLLR